MVDHLGGTAWCTALLHFQLCRTIGFAVGGHDDRCFSRVVCTLDRTVEAGLLGSALVSLASAAVELVSHG